MGVAVHMFTIFRIRSSIFIGGEELNVGKVGLWLTVVVHFQIQILVKARTTAKFFAIRIYFTKENNLRSL